MTLEMLHKILEMWEIYFNNTSLIRNMCDNDIKMYKYSNSIKNSIVSLCSSNDYEFAYVDSTNIFNNIIYISKFYILLCLVVFC